LAIYGRPAGYNAEEISKLRESRLRENDAYYIIDTEDDLNRKWPRILEGRPDFLKIYLLTSEEFEERKARTDTIGDKGLDPRLVPLIVQRAHATGLRVSAHVDSAVDYRIALKAGVDEMAHLPGYYMRLKDEPLMYQLTEDDARETARRGVWVDVAPVAGEIYGASTPEQKAELRERIDAVRVHNLRLLKSAGAKLAFASDRYGHTPIDDVLHLHKLGVFSNLEMLKIWCEDTPRSIFPTRRIGSLKEGYEASFLVLGGDPLVDFEQIKNVRLRFKQGQPLGLT
jgi:imidazolonepropionase-like amidohydrolase